MSERHRPPVTLLVTYGTDHHRFARLTAWLESWLERHPEVTCLAQEGSSPAPSGAVAVGLVPREELLDMMRTSTIVVGQGGPGTVLDASVVGKLPIVVPRLARHGEVVDDHQVAFCRRMAADGRALTAESAEELHGYLDTALVDPSSVLAEDGPGPIADTIANVEALLVSLAVGRPGFVNLGRLSESLRAGGRRRTHKAAAAY